MNVLITGTSSGLGHALAAEFLENGATVFGISRTLSDRLNRFADYYHLMQDISMLDELPGKLKDFMADVNTLDLVILNAGNFPGTNEISRIKVEEIINLMRVNAWANKVIIDTLLGEVPNLYQVVAITSGPRINDAKGLHIYSMTKWALNTLIKMYAAEVPETHFSAVAPGIINSGVQEYISRLPDDNSCPVIRNLKVMRENDRLTDPAFAANYLVEAMGLVLQEESGSFSDVTEILFHEANVAAEPGMSYNTSEVSMENQTSIF